MRDCGSARVCLCVLVGTGLSMSVSPDQWLLLCLLGMVLLGLCAKGGIARDVALAFLLLSGTAFLSSERMSSGLGQVRMLGGVSGADLTTVCGTVSGFPEKTRAGTSLVLRVVEDGGRRTWLRSGENVLVRIKRDLSDCNPGDTLRVVGTLRNTLGERNPGGFSEASYLFGQGICYVLEAPGFLPAQIARAQRPGNFLSVYVAPMRRWIRERVSEHLCGEERAFLLALILGERGEFSPQLRAAFRDAGLVHILSVSGLHTALVGLVGFIFFRGAGLKERTSLLGSVLLVWFYCSLSGFHPSTVRASFMLTCMATSRVLGRSTELFAPLCTSCAVLLLLNPRYFWDTGFQLSYTATASILAGARVVGRLRERLWRRDGDPSRMQQWFWRYLVSTSLTTTLAQLGVLPLLALQFGRVSAVAVPANLLGVPLASGGLVSAFCSLIVTGVFPWVAQYSFSFAWLLLRLCNLVAESASSLPFASLELARPHSLEVVGFLCSFFVFLHALGQENAGETRAPGLRTGRRSALSRRLERLVLGIAVGSLALLGSRFLGLWAPFPGSESQVLKIDFLDVGQGDAAVLELPGGDTWLLDAGDTRAGWDSGERVLVPYLRAKEQRFFDVAIVSHFHSDHAGGLLSLVEGGRVKRVVHSGADTSSAYWHLVAEKCLKSSAALEKVASGETIFESPFVPGPCGEVESGTRLLVLHPTGRATADTSSASLNDSSLVCVLETHGARFLFPGDVGGDILDRILLSERGDVMIKNGGSRRAGGDLTVLKAPHHGARVTLNRHFAGRVRPDYVIFSVGANNRFGHPATEVVQSYLETGAKILRTDEEGCVSFIAGGGRDERFGLKRADPGSSHPFIASAKKWRAERALRLLALLSLERGGLKRPDYIVPKGITGPP